MTGAEYFDFLIQVLEGSAIAGYLIGAGVAIISNVAAAMINFFKKL